MSVCLSEQSDSASSALQVLCSEEVEESRVNQRENTRRRHLFAKDLTPVMPAVTYGDSSVILLRVKGTKQLFSR